MTGGMTRAVRANFADALDGTPRPRIVTAARRLIREKQRQWRDRSIHISRATDKPLHGENTFLAAND
jgi:hypothetical protein